MDFHILKAIKNKETDPEGSLRVGNYLALWGDENQRDLEGIGSEQTNEDGSRGEFFTKSTDFNSSYLEAGMVPVDFEHGQQPDGIGPGRDDVLGYVDVKSIKKDDVGLWAERVLLRRDKYSSFIAQLVEAGMIGNSSEAVSGQVEKSVNGEIVRWPLKRDSLTVMPMEPRMMSVNTVQALKALSEIVPELKGLLPEDVENVGEDEGEAKEKQAAAVDAAKTIEIVDKGDNLMGEKNEELTLEGVNGKVDELSKGINEVLDIMKKTPQMRDGGYYSDEGGNADETAKSFGDLLLSIQRGDEIRLKNVYGVGKAMGTGTGEGGGYLVPTDFRAQLLDVAAEKAIVRPNATVLPNVGLSGEIPALDYSVTPTAGSGETARAGGVKATKTKENASSTETAPDFRMLKYSAIELSGHTKVPYRLINHSPMAVETILKRLFGYAIAAKEDYLFLMGSGIGEPLGMLNASNGALINVTPDTDNKFAPADSAEMLARFEAMGGNPLWLAHRSLITDLQANFGGTDSEGRKVMPKTIWDYPIKFSQHVPQADNSGCVALIDPYAYFIFDCESLSISFSEHVGFLEGQGTWRFQELLDGKPGVLSPITLADPQGSYTVSPFVKFND